ncbi:hypothetical protein G6F32_007463 [Rhizopus arrhizus]|nr:hypothetical protein G6F32_007463 [Rhizopus arrhizus]
MEDTAYYITEQCLSLLKKRIQYRNKPFLKQLETNGLVVFKYEDPSLLEYALDVIPLQRLYEEASPEPSVEDNVIKRLLHWFKNEFFTWVNNPPCDHCGHTETRWESTLEPTADEKTYGAFTVEGFRCLACTRQVRFPRYRAVGAQARIVYDSTDHVWTEVYSEFEQRWIHCDSCEEAWDRPLLYSLGWNKKLSYCIAFSTVEALDVTKRYTQGWSDVLKRRNQVREIELALFLDDLTKDRQKSFGLERKRELNEKRVKELIELEELSLKRMAKEDERVGRQSGSAEWRAMRGEIGNELKIDTFTLLGSCRQTGQDVVRLTDNKISQTGAFYHPQPILLDDFKGVEVEFALRIIGQGADGLAFLIQAADKEVLGEGGCQLGYGGIKNSVAVEFDTYQSSDRCADPSANHISVHARQPPYPNSAHHDHSLGCTSSIPPLATGQWIKVKIQIDLDGVRVGLCEKQQYIQVLDVQLDVLKYLDYPKSNQAWIGFTASTGGLTQIHEVQWIELNIHCK